MALGGAGRSSLANDVVPRGIAPGGRTLTVSARLKKSGVRAKTARFPSTRKTTWSPCMIPKASRTAFGTVTCPLEVTLAAASIMPPYIYRFSKDSATPTALAWTAPSLGQRLCPTVGRGPHVGKSSGPAHHLRPQLIGVGVSPGDGSDER